MIYYEIWNTMDEWKSDVTARWKTFNLAYKDMKNHCDWYGSLGSGTIYKISIETLKDGRVTKKFERVYRSYGIAEREEFYLGYTKPKERKK